MHVSTLVTITPARPASRSALRAFVTLARRVRSLEGFLRWQTFRAMDASDALLVVIDWECPEAVHAAERSPALAAARELTAELGYAMSPAEVLYASFDRQLVCSGSVATLLRMGRSAPGRRGCAARDSDLALKALAAPGSTRLYGAHNEAATVGACRIDFDTEDGIWHFLDSPLRSAWSEGAGRAGEEEVWAINLPRLEYCRAAAEPLEVERPVLPSHTLNVELAFANEGRWARLRFQGRIDGLTLNRCETLCRAIMQQGCERLEVDVSGLTSISAEALLMLAEAARYLKERGSQFVLIDNEERVKRVTRSKHLEASVR
ncbi:MAG TPA: STAS domain-containing protein [Armatimonadota bacterium]|nr:STAS domain-containing protein [Armatimonadota bacterium]